MFLKASKMIVSAFLALLLAQALNLTSASAAAIIAILSVADTRKSTLLIAAQRLVSTLLALLVGVLVFQTVGYTSLSFGLYLALYIPLAFLSRVSVGIAPSSVLVLHMWSVGSTSLALLINEVLLMLVGAGLAILMNWYMPSYGKQIEAYRLELELGLKAKLALMAQALSKGQKKSQELAFDDLDALMEKAQAAVYLESDNQMFSQVKRDLHYFEMRSEQLTLLKAMAKHLAHFSCTLEQAQQLAQLFALTADQLQEHNPAKALMEEMELALEAYRASQLPQSRQEFENRALLFQMLQDLKRFIAIKVAYYDKYGAK